MAVQRSIEQTERMENGKERLQVVDLVFFKQTLHPGGGRDDGTMPL